jgi:patatin-like phospholipase/acyl hydrolase
MADTFRVLSLDGGGAKGFYTLGILRRIEALIGCPLHERFDLIFGTSTGSIIASLLALGKSVEEILVIYNEHVPTVMKKSGAHARSTALAALSSEVYGETMFTDMKTYIGIVATRWIEERPMIFKTSVDQAHGGESAFSPGFGVLVGDAVQASCSAIPFFNHKTVVTDQGDKIELIDGGFCANNPTLYAIAEATHSLKIPRQKLRVVSLGVGTYPPRTLPPWRLNHWLSKTPGVKIAQKTFEINTQSMEQLRSVLFRDVPTVRINQEFAEPSMATDMFEYDLEKLNILLQRGAKSYADNEEKLKEYLL